ncbi:MAG: type I DNA topoisomerase [Dehalococcoidia bacterium]|nr:type I DNA topoisomerase [Dehalococcoidia bacterium]
MYLVVVESPTKAKTIKKFLSSEYEVLASVGHVRDIPSKKSEIPEKFRKDFSEEVIGININKDFTPTYVMTKEQKKRVSELKKIAKKADSIFLATDEDREGEAIAWHILEEIGDKIPAKRMVFHEITESAILEAIKNTREIDRQLVDAQEARRILDRLVGYQISPILWRTVQKGLSAGRVQSSALKILVDRERIRMQFKPSEYASIKITTLKKNENIEFRLLNINKMRIAIGKDIDGITASLLNPDKTMQLDYSTANEIKNKLTDHEINIISVTTQQYETKGPRPFTTSTLQQESGRKLKLSTRNTMSAAQELYENGFITYMRTDSVSIASSAINGIRQAISTLYGEKYLSKAPKTYASKNKNTQEAHEAIRPAGDMPKHPDDLPSTISSVASKLYKMIWQRTLASQMTNTQATRMKINATSTIDKDMNLDFVAQGSKIDFDGFQILYKEDIDDIDEIDEKNQIFPEINEGEVLAVISAVNSEHVTKPINRFTEASLVKMLEELSIGRPSTYSATIQTIINRKYAFKKGTTLIPTFTGIAITQLLEAYFPELVDLDFTARMENDLDSISTGKINRAPWLSQFYFGDTQTSKNLSSIGLRKRIEHCWENIDPRLISSIQIGTDDQGTEIALRVGQFGPYLQIGDTDKKIAVSNEVPPDELTVSSALAMLNSLAVQGKNFGEYEGGGVIELKTGKFGPYIQVTDESLDDPVVKRAGLWPNMILEDINRETALQLLEYPKEIGIHPDDDKPVTAHYGRRGPYLKSGSKSASIESYEKLEHLTLDDAIALLASKPSQLEIGEDTNTGLLLIKKNGRFGPYVTDGKKNASIPKEYIGQEITIEIASELMEKKRIRDSKK